MRSLVHRQTRLASPFGLSRSYFASAARRRGMGPGVGSSFDRSAEKAVASAGGKFAGAPLKKTAIFPARLGSGRLMR